MGRPTESTRSIVWRTNNIVLDANSGTIKYGVGGWDKDCESSFIAKKLRLNTDPFGGHYWTANAVKIYGKNRLFGWFEFYYSPTSVVQQGRSEIWLENDRILGKYLQKMRYLLVLAEEYEKVKKSPENVAFEANKLLVEIVDELLQLFSEQFSRKKLQKNLAEQPELFSEKLDKHFPSNC